MAQNDYIPKFEDTIPYKEPKQVEEPSTTSDFLTALGQGASFGFSDEALAAIKALKEGSKKGLEFSEIKDLYEKKKEIEQAKVKSAEARSPTASLAGGITGAIGGALVTPGLGLAKIGQAATRLGKMAAAAKVGGAYGGLYGL